MSAISALFFENNYTIFCNSMTANAVIFEGGTTGVTGPQGTTGVIGFSGPQGQRGPTGITGATGLQGTIGPTGLMGYTGPQGTTGPNGSIGFTGVNAPNINNIGAELLILSNQDYPNDNMPILWDSTVTYGGADAPTYNAGTGELTINFAGTYIIGVNLAATAITEADPIYADFRFLINGTNQLVSSVIATSFQNYPFVFTGTLAEGDTISMTVRMSAGLTTTTIYGAYMPDAPALTTSYLTLRCIQSV